MATPPARTELADTYPNPSNATFRTGIGKLYDYVTTLLGATGNAAQARAALGVAQDGPRFRAMSNVNTVIPNSTTTLVPMELEYFDPSGAYNNTTYRFRPLVAGYYDIKWGLGLNNNGASTLSLLIGSLRKNGAEYSRSQQFLPAGVQGAGVQGGDVVFLNGTTDYVELYAFGTVASGTLSILAGGDGNFTFLSCHYIGP